MKIGKYIFQIVPYNSKKHVLDLPYNNSIWYTLPYAGFTTTFIWKIKKCKHIKPNTGIRYKILGKYWKLLIIKQLN